MTAFGCLRRHFEEEWPQKGAAERSGTTRAASPKGVCGGKHSKGAKGVFDFEWAGALSMVALIARRIGDGR